MYPLQLVLAAALLICSHGLPDYQANLPNGYKVPHPCFNAVWKGVGHQNHEGGGFLNPFGEDFRKNGYVWDYCLCTHDSDGDGMTNGEELGDPNCVWSMGDLPEFLEAPSHPGVCEPVNSTKCMELNTFEVCKPIEFTCEGMEEEDSFTRDTAFPEITVPAKETSYWCYAVEFNETADLHAFAMEPLLDNVDLVHHIDMYECPEGPQADNALSAYAEPTECGQMEGCGGNMLAAWALGISGICLPDDVGIRIGKFGAKVAVLRIHYHNPFEKEGETDASGLMFHMTPDIRTYDAQVLNLGQMYLDLPPGQSNIEVPLTCGDFCTNSFKQDIKLAFGAMHMHYLGTGGYAELWRNGQKVEDLMIQDFYDYNSPHLEVFDPPKEIKVGDTIKHSCTFQSRDRTDWVYRGQSAEEEMCHIYFVHYPAQNLTECFNEGEVQTCKYRFEDNREKMPTGACDVNAFRTEYEANIKATMQQLCDSSEVDQQCLPGCGEYVNATIANHTCLHQTDPVDTYDYTLKSIGGEFTRMMHSCVYVPPAPPVVATTREPIPCGTDGGNTGTVARSSLYSLLLFVLVWKIMQ